MDRSSLSSVPQGSLFFLQEAPGSYSPIPGNPNNQKQMVVPAIEILYIGHSRDWGNIHGPSGCWVSQVVVSPCEIQLLRTPHVHRR